MEKILEGFYFGIGCGIGFFFTNHLLNKFKLTDTKLQSKSIQYIQPKVHAQLPQQDQKSDSFCELEKDDVKLLKYHHGRFYQK